MIKMIMKNEEICLHLIKMNSSSQYMNKFNREQKKIKFKGKKKRESLDL